MRSGELARATLWHCNADLSVMLGSVLAKLCHLMSGGVTLCCLPLQHALPPLEYSLLCADPCCRAAQYRN
jgi:hypothetical protein